MNITDKIYQIECLLREIKSELNFSNNYHQGQLSQEAQNLANSFNRSSLGQPRECYCKQVKSQFPLGNNYGLGRCLDCPGE